MRLHTICSSIGHLCSRISILCKAHDIYLPLYIWWTSFRAVQLICSNHQIFFSAIISFFIEVIFSFFFSFPPPPPIPRFLDYGVWSLVGLTNTQHSESHKHLNDTKTLEDFFTPYNYEHNLTFILYVKNWRFDFWNGDIKYILV